MSVSIQDIKSADWSLSTKSAGGVSEGIDDINQCIGIILGTQKGSDPFRPTFGSDIWDWIDRPLPIAVPNMKRAIYEAIGLWEPRVIVTSVEHVYQNEAGLQEPVQAGIKMDIAWKLRKTQTTGSVQVTLGLYDKIVKAAQQLPVISGAKLLTTEGGDLLTTEAAENIAV